MENRKARRQAERRKRRPARNNGETNDLYMPENHADDRVLAGMANLPQAMPLIESEFNSLHEILGLIEVGLNDASSADREHWFPNNIAALACLVRAYQGLQASACLCVLGFYTESMATMRVVYESAGLARALAHKRQDAEDWFHKGHWKSDGFSRKFQKEMTETSARGGINYQEFYEQASQYAHPMAKSVLPMLFDPKNNHFRPQLYPEFDAEYFHRVSSAITVQAVFVAFTLRNAAAATEVFPASWLKRLNEIAEEVTGQPVADAQRARSDHDRQHEQLINLVKHDDELDAALDSDPNSVRNLRRRAREGEPGMRQG